MGIKMPKGIPRDNSTQHTILHRLAIARGHLEKVIAMVEHGHYCIDVVHQSLAVQAALRETDQVILKNHMETCVADAIVKGNKTEVIDEVMKILEKK
jgi:DNA-binding FrmR family transcriptional regulator